LNRIAVLVVVLGVLATGCGGDAAGDTRPSAREVTKHLKASGLPIGKVTTYSASSDPNDLLGRPKQYVAKANFRDRRADNDGDKEVDAAEGGSVEVFVDEGAAKTREEYLRAISESGPLFAEYVYRDGLVLLRVSSELTPNQAGAYEEALGGL